MLRHLAESDAEELDRVVTANREHLARWLQWVDATADVGIEARREFILRAQRQDAASDGFQAAIVDGDEIIGIVGFHRVEWSNRATSISMTEAVRALVQHPFEAWNLDRIEIRVADGNRGSSAIPRRLGFVEEGTLREAERHADGYEDVVVYWLLRADRR